MGLIRRILSSFKPRKEEEKKSSNFLRNGGELLAELLAFSNGRYGIPIRTYTAEELVKATNNFSERVFANNETVMVKGHLDGRQVLVNKWTDGRSFPRNEVIFPRNEVIRDFAVATNMNQHKNVLKLIGCCLEFDFPASVYEYAGKILLSDLLDSGSENTLLSWKSRIKISRDIASTLLYLHTEFPTPVIYRNIKPSKVIIEQDHGVAKLFDFTLAIPLPPGESRVEDVVLGTFGFADPEYLASSFVTLKSDVYSFGMFLLVLLTGKSVRWENPNQTTLEERNTIPLVDYVRQCANNHQYDQIVDPRIMQEEGGVGNGNLFESFVDLALMCIRENGEDRPEMIDVARQLQHMEKSIRNHLPSISSN